MRVIRIPKGRKGFREIVVPSAKVKRKLRECIPKLQDALRNILQKKLFNIYCEWTSSAGTTDILHGFVEMRNPVTNALKHVGFEYTICVDLQDFFDYVFWGVVPGDVRALVPSCAWYKGVAKQGLPTSPILANICAVSLDYAILSNLHKLFFDAEGGRTEVERTKEAQYVYTRYADDICVSLNKRHLVKPCLDKILDAIGESGFAYNPRKIKIYSAKGGRRIITGIGVGKNCIYITRKTRRKIRAARHNLKYKKIKKFPIKKFLLAVKLGKAKSKEEWLEKYLARRLRGLEEWAKLKLPCIGRRSLARLSQAGGCSLARILRR